MIKQLKSLSKEKTYLICLCLSFLLGYGFFLSYVSFYVDDTAMGRYFTDGRWLRQGRWGLWLLTNLFHQTEFNSFIHKICGMIVFFFSCVLIGGLLKKVSEDKLSIRAVTFFSCIMATYSLINEILFYVIGQWMYSLIYLLSVLSVWYAMRDRKIKSISLSVLFLTLGLSITEGAAGTYIILIITCMLLTSYYRPSLLCKISDCVKDGILHIGILALSVALERVLAIFFCMLTGWDMQARSPLWFTNDFFYVLKSMMVTILINYGIRAFFYFPIAEYLIAVFANVVIVLWCCFRKEKVKAFLWSMFALGSLAFSIVQGEASPNRVVWQVFSIYIAFLVSMICERLLLVCKKGVVSVVVIGGVGLIVLWQISDLNMWEWVNYMRNHEEIEVIDDLGRELQINYEIEEKPVVFVGEYQLSENIIQYTHVKSSSGQDALARKIMRILPGGIEYQRRYIDSYGYQFNETGSNSVITWGVRAFQEVNTELLKLFAYQGYVFKQGTEEMYNRGLETAQDMPSWPKEGSIVDMEDFILVNFGL